MKSGFYLFLLVMGCLLVSWADGDDKKQAIAEAIELEKALQPFHQKKSKPQPGEWAYHKKEKTQSFKAYTKWQRARVTDQRNKLYIVRIGTFNAAQKKVLDQTIRYMEVYFQLPVAELDPMNDAMIPAAYRRKQPQGDNMQFNATKILHKILKPRLPDDGLALMGFTATDLYPRKKWNFVFGLANPVNRCGIWSIHRFGDPNKSEANYALCLKRTRKVATHETGHLLHFAHCNTYNCNMNGSMDLEESDRQVPYLCPVCLSKMKYATHVPHKKRLSALRDYWKREENDNLVRHYNASIKALP